MPSIIMYTCFVSKAKNKSSQLRYRLNAMFFALLLNCLAGGYLCERARQHSDAYFRECPFCLDALFENEQEGRQKERNTSPETSLFRCQCCIYSVAWVCMLHNSANFGLRLT